MGYVSFEGFDDSRISSIPTSLTLAALFVPFLPGEEGAVETVLPDGRTKIVAPFLGGTMEVIVTDYKRGILVADGEEWVVIKRGTIDRVEVDGALQQVASRLDIDVRAFEPAVVHFLEQDDAAPLLRLTMALGWEFDGRDVADNMQWELNFGGLSNRDLFTGDDRFDGKGGNDLIRLYGGDDTGIGGSGRDRLWGDTGRDALSGGAGGDRLFGGAGADTLSGGAGNDQLWGDDGDDLLRPGAGADIIHMRTGDRADVVEGFEGDLDRIFWHGEGEAEVSRDGDNTWITWDDGTTLILIDVLPGDLGPGVFL